MHSLTTAALAEKKCVPCEADDGALDAMGLCGALGKSEAKEMLSEVS
jgi:hypothetical protein